MIAIVTFNKNMNDADFIRKDNGSVMLFDSVQQAEIWMQDNDSRLCDFSKIIDTDE